jgi:hypothetical protein
VGPCVASGWSAADSELRRYLVRLGEAGFVDWARVVADVPHRARGASSSAAVTGPTLARYEDASAAGAMLMAALFSDAMGRDMMPELFPQPAERAPVLYVRLFLRAIECRVRPARQRHGRDPLAAVERRTATDADRPRPRARRRAS